MVVSSTLISTVVTGSHKVPLLCYVLVVLEIGAAIERHSFRPVCILFLLSVGG